MPTPEMLKAIEDQKNKQDHPDPVLPPAKRAKPKRMNVSPYTVLQSDSVEDIIKQLQARIHTLEDAILDAVITGQTVNLQTALGEPKHAARPE